MHILLILWKWKHDQLLRFGACRERKAGDWRMFLPHVNKQNLYSLKEN